MGKTRGEAGAWANEAKNALQMTLKLLEEYKRQPLRIAQLSHGSLLPTVCGLFRANHLVPMRKQIIF